MDEWHDFIVAQAGPAGVLTGLVFVGVSINLPKIVSDPGPGLLCRAAQALILLVGVLTASILLLVPGQGPVMVGAEVLTIGFVTWGCCAHPAAAAENLAGYEARAAPSVRAACGAGSHCYATTGGGRHRCADRWAGRSLLACGGHTRLDPRGVVRRLGVAHRDQPVGEDRGFSPPYSPECVEGKFCELRLDGVLGSALHKDMLQLYLLSREPFTLSQGRYLPSH
jgi:hypothetical protein